MSSSTPLPGKNGTPTFAAVAAGYDKSPGEEDAARHFGFNTVLTVVSLL